MAGIDRVRFKAKKVNGGELGVRAVRGPDGVAWCVALRGRAGQRYPTSGAGRPRVAGECKRRIGGGEPERGSRALEGEEVRERDQERLLGKRKT